MSKETTTYSISVKVRDENGKVLKSPSSEEGRFIPEPRIQFEFVFGKDEDYSHGIEGAIEVRMRNMARTFRAWIPEGYSIDIDASVHNSISNTYMCMYCFYESEDRFVKLT